MVEQKKSFVDLIRKTRPQVNNDAEGFAEKFAPAKASQEETVIKRCLNSEAAGGIESKIDSLKKKHEKGQTDGKESAAEKIKRSRLDCLFLVKGFDDVNQRHAWHYVLVHKPLRSKFIETANNGPVDVSKYGDVIRSGWGKEPSPEIVEEIKKEFGE